MTQGELITICKDAIMTAIKISAPFLGVSLSLGLIISIIQAATQVHEQNITFVPKIIATAAMLITGGSWIITIMVNFTQRIFTQL